MAITGGNKRAQFHLFRIGYPDGKEKWIAYETKGLLGLTIAVMKRRIEASESETKKSSGAKLDVWYYGKLILLK